MTERIRISFYFPRSSGFVSVKEIDFGSNSSDQFNAAHRTCGGCKLIYRQPHPL